MGPRRVRGSFARAGAAARVLADACAVSAGQEVLDVAAGDGNFALACASEGAGVVATDISPGQVELGRARSEEEGYDIEWQEADAGGAALRRRALRLRRLGVRHDDRARPEVVARELFRVVRRATRGHHRVDAGELRPSRCSRSAGATCPSRRRSHQRRVGS